MRRRDDPTPGSTVPTLGSQDGSLVTRAYCDRCRHHVVLDIPALRAKYGPAMTLPELRTHLVCSACGHRGASLTCSARQMEGLDPR